ncbi:MAG: glycosyltransferase family 2 protein, partial [Alphaproteobacteria bacterium]
GTEAALEAGPWLRAEPPPPFRQFRPTRPFVSDLVLSGWVFSARRLREEAARAVREGHRTSLYLFSPTARRHRVRFTAAGVWEQTGGLFGKSERSDPPLRLWRRKNRVAREWKRTAGARQTVVSPAT